MQIAIIGAGIAGLSAARTIYAISPGLMAHPNSLTVFEKSRGLGGRAATRWFDRPQGRIYVDHGAQYLKAEGSILPDLLHNVLPHESLTQIVPPVWTFDAQNYIAPGEREQNVASSRLTYQTGIATLGRLLVAEAGLTVKTQIRIGSLRLNADGTYALIDAEATHIGDFDQVIVAIPAGQAADLIAASTTLPTGVSNALESVLRGATYRRCLSVILGYDRPPTERPYSALINIDRQHPIVWIGLEHAKPGHVPVGCSVYVVQMSASYSLAQWETEKATVIREVAGLASQVLGEDLTAPAWTDMQTWRYSQPDVMLDPALVNGKIPGLWFAGDYLRGGRVHLAAEVGAEVGAAVAAMRDGQSAIS